MDKNCFDPVCLSGHRSSFLVFGPGWRRSSYRDWNPHWHWNWPSLSSSILLPSVPVLLSATVLLCPISVWVCGSSPRVRATSPRLRPTGTSTSAILLSAVVGIPDACTHSNTADTSTRRHHTTIVIPVDGRLYTGDHTHAVNPIHKHSAITISFKYRKAHFAFEASGPFSFLGGGKSENSEMIELNLSN